MYRRVKKFVHKFICHSLKIQDCSHKNVLFLSKNIRNKNKYPFSNLVRYLIIELLIVKKFAHNNVCYMKIRVSYIYVCVYNRNDIRS